MKKIIFVFLALITLSFSAFAAVNLNTATQTDLETLDGVGPAKAKAIIEYRKKNGNFKSAEDLNNVPGFGDKTLASLKGKISVSGASEKAAPAKAASTDVKADKKK